MTQLALLSIFLSQIMPSSRVTGSPLLIAFNIITLILVISERYK